MNLDIILNGYYEMTITYNTLKNFDKNLTIKELNENLKELLSELEILNLGKTVTKIIINKNGMFFDLTKLKNELYKHFNLQENDPNNLTTIKKLTNSLNDYDAFESLTNFYPSISKSFKSTTENSSKTRKEKKIFLRQIRRILILFRKLLTNEIEYSKVNYSKIDLKKLSLYLAYQIEYQSEEFKQNNEQEKRKKTLEYLQRYIENTKDILPYNYSFFLKGKPYLLNKIKDYLHQNIQKPKEEEEDINYNFFECDKLNGTKLLKKYFQLGQSKINQAHLQEIHKRKIDLYTSINFTKIKLGKNSYNGYIGFVLENGYIILDKLFDDITTGKISCNNAIYIIKEKDFDNLTKLSKSKVIELMKKETYNITRIIHNSQFEEKVRSYIK